MNSHIVRNPTSDTSPGIIVRPRPRDIDDVLYSYIPCDFDKACLAARLIDEHVGEVARKDKGADTDIIAGAIIPLLYATVIGGVPSTASLTMILNSSLSNTAKFIMSFVLVTTILAVTARRGVKLAIHNGYLVDRNPYQLSRKAKKALRSVDCVNTAGFYSYSNFRQLRRVLSRSEDAINLPELRAAYNNYAELLGFLCANKDMLSYDLTNEYYAELKRRRSLLDAEVDTAESYMREREKISAEFEHEQESIAQEMRDSDALRIMPLPHENKDWER